MVFIWISGLGGIYMISTNYGSVSSSLAKFPAKGKTLAQYTWNEIDMISQAGLASEYFAIGNEKNIVVNGETLTLQIYDFNHDTLSSNGTSKAGITFGTKHLMATKKAITPDGISNGGGWTYCNIRSWLNNTLFEQLPIDLIYKIKTVNKLTSIGERSDTIGTTQDKLFLFSEVECIGSTIYSKPGEGTKYPIFTDNTSRIKKLSNGIGTNQDWWTRSPSAGGTVAFIFIYNGSGMYMYPGQPYGTAFGFCI